MISMQMFNDELEDLKADIEKFNKGLKDYLPQLQQLQVDYANSISEEVSLFVCLLCYKSLRHIKSLHMFSQWYFTLNTLTLSGPYHCHHHHSQSAHRFICINGQ